ncbi:MAG: PocR ligand-binding domain-containing protein [Cyanobacteriota bacterium]
MDNNRVPLINRIEEIINKDRLTEILHRFSEITGCPVEIHSATNNNLMSSVGMQDICLNFHFEHKESQKECYKTKRFLAEKLNDSTHMTIRICENGLADGCVPIIKDGYHIGNLFIGQVLLGKPDIEEFRQRAQDYGYNEEAYIKALLKVPIIDEVKFKTFLKYLSDLFIALFEIEQENYQNIQKEKELKEQKIQIQKTAANLSESKSKIIDAMIKLNSSYSLFQTVADAAQDAIVFSDTSGKISYWNNAAEKMFGYSKEEIVGFDIYNIIEPPKIYNNGKTNGNNKIFELPGIKKDGQKFFTEITVSNIVQEDTFITVYIIRDVTERKRLEKELQDERDNLEKTVQIRTKELDESLKDLKNANLWLQEAYQYKNRFLSNMSHELRTPLNAIIGFTDMLDQTYCGELNDKQSEYIKLIKERGQHLLLLINSILDIAMIDTGSMQLECEEFFINNIVSNIYDSMEIQFTSKNIQFIKDLSDKVSLINADKKKCKQILLNLLNNAFKFTPENGKVIVKTEPFISNNIKISVIDNGIGISDEELDDIFAEFYQLNQLHKKKTEGVGIGLTLAKSLIEMHGGEIGVESEPDKGSTFWFTLPLTCK